MDRVRNAMAAAVESLQTLETALVDALRSNDAWRALGQLDERESTGHPVESIDATHLRRFLEEQVDATSPTWQALHTVRRTIAALRAEAARIERLGAAGTETPRVLSPIPEPRIMAAPQPTEVRPAPRMATAASPATAPGDVTSVEETLIPARRPEAVSPARDSETSGITRLSALEADLESLIGRDRSAKAATLADEKQLEVPEAEVEIIASRRLLDVEPERSPRPRRPAAPAGETIRLKNARPPAQPGGEPEDTHAGDVEEAEVEIIRPSPSPRPLSAHQDLARPRPLDAGRQGRVRSPH